MREIKTEKIEKRETLTDLLRDYFKPMLKNPKRFLPQELGQFSDQSVIALALGNAGKDPDKEEFYRICASQRDRLNTQQGQKMFCLDYHILEKEHMRPALEKVATFIKAYTKWLRERELASIEANDEKANRWHKIIRGET